MFSFLLAKGISSLVAGQLLSIESIGWGIPDVFAATAILVIASTLVLLLNYHAWVKKYEAKVLEDKAAILERMAKRKEGDKAKDNGEDNGGFDGSSSSSSSNSSGSVASHARMRAVIDDSFAAALEHAGSRRSSVVTQM